MNARPLLLLLSFHLINAANAKAEAPDSKTRAAALFQQARAAFGRHDYAAAAAAFEQAATIEPHPAALLNAADAWEANGDFTAAASACDRALLLPTIDDRYRAEAEKRLVRLGAKVGTYELRGDSSIVVRVDGGAEISVPSKVRLVPGHHVFARIDHKTNERRTEEVDIAEGETKEFSLTSPAPVAASAPSPPPPPPLVAPEVRTTWAPPTATWVALGVAGGAAAFGVGFGAATLSARDSYVSSPTEENRSSFYANRSLSTVSWIVAGASAGVGISYWLLTGPRRIEIHTGVAAGGASIEGSMRF